MAIFLGIVGFIFLLLFLDQYFKDEEEREKKKAEAEYKRKLEIERLHNLKLEQDRIALEVYRSSLSNNSNFNDNRLTKHQIIVWCLLIVIIALIVSIVVWSI